MLIMLYNFLCMAMVCIKPAPNIKVFIKMFRKYRLGTYMHGYMSVRHTIIPTL